MRLRNFFQKPEPWTHSRIRRCSPSWLSALWRDVPFAQMRHSYALQNHTSHFTIQITIKHMQRHNRREKELPPIGWMVSAGRLETAVCLLKKMTSSTTSPVAASHRWSKSSSTTMLLSCSNSLTCWLLKLFISFLMFQITHK